jgi:hypothetical protein
MRLLNQPVDVSHDRWRMCGCACERYTKVDGQHPQRRKGSPSSPDLGSCGAKFPLLQGEGSTTGVCKTSKVSITEHVERVPWNSMGESPNVPRQFAVGCPILRDPAIIRIEIRVPIRAIHRVNMRSFFFVRKCMCMVSGLR